MNSKISFQFLIFSLLFTLILNCLSAQAQVVPDSTLGNESSKIKSELGDPSITVIEGGATRGVNLFQSFEQFSIPTKSTAYFNNAADIQNILSRVTGKSISNIDGLLKANGNANLFLINPNGIIFGSNARLNIGGSFLASTANSIDMGNNNSFSATNYNSVPLLKVNVPIGLVFTTSNPGAIEVEGTGHNLILNANAVGNPIIGSGQSQTGLRTQPGKTIALIGGDVNFEGGILTAPSGRIEVGSINTGFVKIDLKDNNLFLNYSGTQQFKDILLENLALLDASGVDKGDIFLQGKNITITDPSLVLISNFGGLSSGKISINASNNFGLAGIRFANPTFQYVGPARGIVTQSLSTGKAADIVISASKATLQDFGSIATLTFGSGSGGNISLNARDSVELFSNKLPTKALLVSSISTASYDSGIAGNLSLSTKNLSLANGSFILSQTLDSGNGGNVSINATDTIKISGGTQITFNDNFINNSYWPSFLGAFTSSFGNAGNVLINTGDLILEDGAKLASSTLASGSAGNLTINAKNSIFISGGVSNSLNPTLDISKIVTFCGRRRSKRFFDTEI